MRSIKQIAITILLTAGIFCAVLYTSCSKNACSGVTCLNNGTCSGGTCVCPSGAGGNNCQTIYRLLYANTYVGIGSRDTGSAHADSATMVFSVTADTIYTNMQLIITDSANNIVNVTFPITLTNNSASGSNFMITTPTLSDTTYITGTGNISATSASLNLTLQDQKDSLFHSVSYNNFNKEP